MEHKFEHDPQENTRSWGAYATPPPIPGQTHKTEPQHLVPQRATAVSLCARVQEMLPPLLENDGSIRPEMASAVRAHLAACLDCSREYKTLQRVAMLVEKMPLAELPTDFSARIMQRIQAEHQPAAPEAVVRAEVSIQTPAAKNTAKTAVKNTKINTATRTATTQKSGLTQTAWTMHTLAMWQKVTLAGMFAATLAFFLSTAWGRALLGTRLETALQFLSQVTEAVRRVPVLGWIADYAFNALSQAEQTLQMAYRSMGAGAAQGLALDVALCAGAGFALAMQKRTRNESRGN